MDHRLLGAADLLGQNGFGTAGLVAGTRDYVIDSLYRMVYRVDAAKNQIEILAVVHYRRKYP